MRSLRYSPVLVFLLAAGLLHAAAAQAAEALAPEAAEPQFVNAFSTLHRFSDLGHWPRGGVALDAKGNIFGTTLYGGNCSTCGIIYELVKPTAAGRPYAFRALHNFVLGPDGIAPTAPLRIVDGKIYGTTSAGANPSCGCGEVFRLVPSGSGYAYQVLHRFDRTRGTTPIGGVLVGSTGTIIGTASGGGANSAGVIYKITSGGVFSVLHHFTGPFNSGPQGELTFGKDGAIYGTTFGGGRYNQGTVFRITTAGAFSTLYDFKNNFQTPPTPDGANPDGRLAVGPDGTLYGTTPFGGVPSGYGTAYSLTPPRTAGGAWTYRQLYLFGRGLNSPNTPHSGFVRDSSGHLYGTSAGGGANGGGTLYRLGRASSGAWTATVLHHFKPRDANGDTPFADIALVNGRIYGSTLTGGILGGGGRAGAPADFARAATCPRGSTGCGTIFSYR